MKLRCYDIEWETDGEVVEDLPTEVIIDIEVNNDYDPENDDSNQAANALSDAYGWLVLGHFVEVLSSL